MTDKRTPSSFAITEDECSALIRASTGTGGVRLTMPGGRLINAPGNDWAIKHLAGMRMAAHNLVEATNGG